MCLSLTLRLRLRPLLLPGRRRLAVPASAVLLAAGWRSGLEGARSRGTPEADSGKYG